MKIETMFYEESVTKVYLFDGDFACRVSHHRINDEWDYTVYGDDEWKSYKPENSGEIDSIVYWLEGVCR